MNKHIKCQNCGGEEFINKPFPINSLTIDDEGPFDMYPVCNNCGARLEFPAILPSLEKTKFTFYTIDKSEELEKQITALWVKLRIFFTLISILIASFIVYYALIIYPEHLSTSKATLLLSIIIFLLNVVWYNVLKAFIKIKNR